MEGVAFVKCNTLYADGRAAPTYWLCDVIRLLDAVDEEKSVLKIVYPTPDRKMYSLIGRNSLFFKEESVGAAHIFRLCFYPMIVCDQVVKDACKEAGLGASPSVTRPNIELALIGVDLERWDASGTFRDDNEAAAATARVEGMPWSFLAHSSKLSV